MGTASLLPCDFLAGRGTNSRANSKGRSSRFGRLAINTIKHLAFKLFHSIAEQSKIDNNVQVDACNTNTSCFMTTMVKGDKCLC